MFKAKSMYFLQCIEGDSEFEDVWSITENPNFNTEDFLPTEFIRYPDEVLDTLIDISNRQFVLLGQVVEVLKPWILQFEVIPVEQQASLDRLKFIFSLPYENLKDYFKNNLMELKSIAGTAF